MPQCDVCSLWPVVHSQFSVSLLYVCFVLSQPLAHKQNAGTTGGPSEEAGSVGEGLAGRQYWFPSARSAQVLIKLIILICSIWSWEIIHWNVWYFAQCNWPSVYSLLELEHSFSTYLKRRNDKPRDHLKMYEITSFIHFAAKVCFVLLWQETGGKPSRCSCRTF